MDYFSEKLCVTILANSVKQSSALKMVKNMPSIVRMINQIMFLNPSKILIVTNNQNDNLVKSVVNRFVKLKNIIYIMQSESGPAIQSILPMLDDNMDNLIFEEILPFIKQSTIQSIHQYYLDEKHKIIITTTMLKNPSGYSRVILDMSANPCEIIHDNKCNILQKKIDLVNCGIYFMKSSILHKYVSQIISNNLSDLVKIISSDKQTCGYYILENIMDILN